MDLVTEPPPPPRPRLGGRAAALLGILGLVIALGLFIAVLVVLKVLPNPMAENVVPVEPAPPAPSPSKLTGSARFAAEGDCVQNLGTETRPDLVMVTCVPGTFEVLARVEGTIDVKQCEKVDGYRYHYFYDSELGDKFDFVLCMRKRG